MPDVDPTAFWSLGGERLDLGTGVLVRQRQAPGHPLGTFLTAVRADTLSAMAALLARADELVPGGCPRVCVDAATPPVVEAFLVIENWHPEHQLHLLLPADVPVPAAQRLPRPLRDEDWPQVEALFRLDHQEEDTRSGRPVRPLEETVAAVALRRALTPAAEYFGVERGGELVALIATWAGPAGGVVEDVFVREDARGAGLATELLRFAVGRLRSAGVGAVLIGADPEDTVKHLYARFGFRPVGVSWSWRRGR